MSTRRPNVLLRGGPAALTETDRLRHVENRDERVRVRHGSGFEHFEATEETVMTDQGHLQVFEWSYRTRIAE
ncbi:DUF5988 family protein [Streptomyces sp. NPDC059740]|uniref:DUF5988 family protein n=1 Tax=Streptomyces sp. NPDC059740 TaxID=3346926 RepID=UPI003656E932